MIIIWTRQWELILRLKEMYIQINMNIFKTNIFERIRSYVAICPDLHFFKILLLDVNTLLQLLSQFADSVNVELNRLLS